MACTKVDHLFQIFIFLLDIRINDRIMIILMSIKVMIRLVKSNIEQHQENVFWKWRYADCIYPCVKISYIHQLQQQHRGRDLKQKYR